VLWGRANQFIDGESFSEAAEFLDALAGRTPDDCEVFRVRAQLRWRIGDYRGALADFDGAQRLDGRNAEVSLQKAEFLAEMGFLDRALVCCQPVASRVDAESHPAAGAFFLMGQIDLNRANYDGALENFSRAIALDPSDPEARARRGLLYLMIGRTNEADQDFARAEKIRVQAESAEEESEA